MKLSGTAWRACGRARFLLLALIAFAGCGKEDSTPKARSLAASAYFIDGKGNAIDETAGQTYGKAHLHVEGQVFNKDGGPVSSGAVKIRVTSQEAKIDQSLFAPLTEQGSFATSQTAFSGIHPGPALKVAVEVVAPGLTESTTIDLNRNSEALKWSAVTVLLVLLAIAGALFLIVFTGKESARRQRGAIRFSYGVIVVFLAIPIVAPGILLHLFRGAVDGMIGYPAGLVVTRIGEKPNDNAQWAVNIGGYSHICEHLCLDLTDPRLKGTEYDPGLVPAAAGGASGASRLSGASASSGASGPSGTIPVKTTTRQAAQPRSPGNARPGIPATPSAAGSPAAATDASGVTGAPGTATANGAQAGTSAATGAPVLVVENETHTSSDSDHATVASRPSSPSAPPNPVEDILHPDRLDAPIVKVEGGLVIPLYVIILSVIGGAINMTRKVPGFQQEGESSDDQADDRARAGQKAQGQNEDGNKADQARALAYVPPPTPASNGQPAGSPTLEQQAEQIDGELGPLVAGQLKRSAEEAQDIPHIRKLVTQMQDLFTKNTEPKLLGFMTYDEWFVSRPNLRKALGQTWRVELLNQYMYLISAPFLAVVTYFLLDLLGLSKSGVVVVLSFSVGLISEKIVTWILGIASGYMQTPKTSAANS